MVGTTTDIDQRKEAELSLGDREQRLRLALEAGDLGVWECDLAAERIQYDALCLSRLGLEPRPDGWPLSDILDLVHPRDRARVRAMFAECRRGHRSQARVEFRMRRPDGGHAWIEEHAQVSGRGRRWTSVCRSWVCPPTSLRARRPKSAWLILPCMIR